MRARSVPASVRVSPFHPASDKLDSMPFLARLAALAGLACLYAVSLPAAEPAPTDPFLRWMDRIAQQHLDRRDKAIAAITTKEAAEARKQETRARFLDSIGGLPDYNGPLNPRVTGVLTNAVYAMENVIFESLPGFYVTANVYRPAAPGRYPAVLMSSGHTTTGKTESHRMAANLAAKGFVSLAYDPIGLGERIQALDPKTRKHGAGCCANEHLHFGAQAMLVGLSGARYFIWDAKRAIDYLVSRPDVDADRIGAAGCSGGGCSTTYIAALDARVKAAAPACYLNSYRLLFAGPHPDTEMVTPGFLAAGLDHADFLEMTAPKPWLILATEGDFFTPPAVKMVYDESRRWYELYGAADNVQMFMGPGPHGTPLETREQLYAWMIRWLKNGEGDPKEHEIPLYTDEQLVVTKSGQVEDEPRSRKVFDLVRAEYQARRELRGPDELRHYLGGLKIQTDRRPPNVRVLESKPEGALQRSRIAIRTEPGLEVEGWLSVPRAQGTRPALVIVHDATSESLAAAAARQGSIVLELEPRDSPASYDKRVYLGKNWMANLRADNIGRNLAAMRAHDILTAVDVLTSRPDVDANQISGIAREASGVWLLLAAAVDPRLKNVWLDRTPHSLAAALDQSTNDRLFDALLPGFLLYWDLGDVARLIQDRKLLWTDPTDWHGRTVTLGMTLFSYRAAGEPDTALFDSFVAK